MEDNELHPIAELASQRIIAGKGAFTPQVLAELQGKLDALRDDPMLGPAVVSLVKVAAHLDKDLGAKVAADALMRMCAAMTPALEAQNKKAKRAQEEQHRDKQKKFNKFLGN